MAIPLVTSWQLEKAAGEPPSIIRVKNLQSHINGPQDAWGRPGRPQPILVSAEVSLVQRFGVSSSRDAVAPDTVHYGQLSKAVLTVLGRIEGQAAKEDEKSLDFVMSSIWAYLTGVQTDGVAAAQAKPFLDMEFVRRLTVSIVLPKASLLGTGVGLTSSAVFQNSVMHIRSLSLNILELRIPTLVGVNENERAAKQVVIANIGVERYTNERDGYVELETVVVDMISKSSFETLEALASHVYLGLTEHLKSSGADAADDLTGWHLRIGLEKPTAIPLAEAACVELRMNTIVPN